MGYDRSVRAAPGISFAPMESGISELWHGGCSGPPGRAEEGAPPVRNLVLALALVGLPSAASAFSYDEGVDGDLSGDRLAPTALVASLGSNPLSATSVLGDLEYVLVAIPSSYQLGSILLTAFASADDVGFAAVQVGSTFTVTPAGATPGDLYGYAHFGTGPLAGGATPGNDMLDDLGAGAGAIGFLPPLGSGNYTFWLQQTQAQPISYTMDFLVIPERATLLLVVGGLAAIASTRRPRAL